MQRRVDNAASPRVSRAWLPDAELDEHPVGTWLLQVGFDLCIRALYRREILCPDNFHIAPGTVIASNHQRDVDGPMLGTVLVHRHGLRFRWPLPFYATREDLFRPGILARLTVHWPKPLPALLGRISLRWFFPLGRAEPMRRVREFTLGETLRALQEADRGNENCATLLNARGCRELNVTAATTLDALLARTDPALLENAWGLRRLRVTAIDIIAPAFRATVAAQLAHFAMRLDRGRCVYFAPEGTISMDGHYERTRAGFFRLCRATTTPPWIQPMALSYDTLAPGRSRVVVRIGEHLRANPELNRRAFDASLRAAVQAVEPLTPSHLLAHFLLHGPGIFSSDALADWLARCLAALRTRNVSLDPLWSRQALARLADQRLRWCEHKRLIERTGESFRNTCPRDATPGWHAPANIVHYLDNRLADLAPGLPPC